MIKKLHYLLLFITISANAQTIDLTWAEKIKTRTQVMVLGGQKGNYFTGHLDKDDRLVCRKYNDNMQLINEETVPFELDQKHFTYHRSIFLKDKITHVISERIRKENKDVLFAAFTDLNLKHNDKTIILDETLEDENTIGFGKTYVSPDSTKILVYRERKGRKKEPSTLVFKVYKGDFTDVLLDKVVEIPIKNRNFSTENISVDNLGNVYVLAKIIREFKEREKGQSAFYFKLVVFDKINATPKEFDFDFENQEIGSIDIIPSKNNTLICTGFLKGIEEGFFSKKISSVSDEMFSAVLDCNTLALTSTFKLKIDGLYPEKIKKREDFVPYLVRNIFPKPDGGYVVVAEQYKLVIYTSYSPQGGSRTSYVYYYCDIACLHVDKSGKLESITKIPKYQLNASNPSIISTYVNGNTYIVYEDLAKNLTAENDKETKKSSTGFFSSDSKNALFVLTIAADGTPKKEIIYDYQESKLRPRIRSSRLINPSTIILNADDQIGKLQFN